MKKLLVLAMVALMVLSGCTKKTDNSTTTTDKPSEKTVLKVAGLLGGYGDAGWKAVASAFEAQTGIKVELKLEKNIPDVLRPAFQAGRDIPDVVYLGVGSAGGLTDTMIAEKQLLDISDLLNIKVPGENVTVKEKLVDNITEGYATKPYDDGKLYLAPINFTPTGLVYDSNLFKTKGWQVPSKLADFEALAEKAKAEGISLFTYPTAGYFDTFFSAVLNAFVGEETYKKLMSYDLASWKLPEVKKAFEFVGMLAKNTEENTVANANSEGFKKNQQLVLDNKAVFMPNGAWIKGEMKDAPRTEGFKWAISAVPNADGSKTFSSTFTEQVWIPSGSKNIDAAKQFIAFLYSDKAVELFYKNGGAVMPTKNASSIIGAEDKAFYSIYEQGAKAVSVGFKAHEKVEGKDIAKDLYETINSVVNKSKTVDEWYQTALSTIEAYSK